MRPVCVTIEAWRTSDERIFSTEDEAIEHEYRLQISGLADKYGIYSEGRDSIEAILTEHGEEVWKVLNARFGDDVV